MTPLVRSEHRSEPAYTLLEILVVLGILMTLTAIAVSTFRSSRAQHALDDAARQTYALLSFAHQSAVASGALGAAPTGGTLTPPLRVSFANGPYTCVVMDGTHYSDGAPATPGLCIKSYQGPAAAPILLAAYWIADASGNPGVAQPLTVPITMVFDPNGSVRRSPTDSTSLETAPPIPAGATVALTFHTDGAIDHVVLLDSVSGGVAFQ